MGWGIGSGTGLGVGGLGRGEISIMAKTYFNPIDM
jgi:hypothetical protein